MKKRGLLLALAVSFCFAGDVDVAAEAYESGDFQKAFKYYKKACEGGNALGCSNVGLLYVKAEGVKQDYVEAKKYYGKACDGGHATACSTLALVSTYVNAEQNYAKTKEYFEKACEDGDAEACFGIGSLYFEAEGVKQDKQAAKRYYGKACDLGLQKGCDARNALNPRIIEGIYR